MKVRVGAVSYLNTHPLVFGLRQGLGAGRVELSYAPPAELADAMLAGNLDIGLLPVIELARMPQLEIMPGLAIGTFGPSRSVVLVSRSPIDQVRSVALDRESRTSNALVRVLFDRVWRRDVQFVPEARGLDEALAACDAAVRIGDKALFETTGDAHHVYDLGQIWTEHTGLPFVFAVWAGVPGAIDRELYRIFHASRRVGSAAIETIARDYRWQGAPHVEIAREYLTRHIRYRLGSPEVAALERFLGIAAELGIIEQVPELRMALARQTPCHDAVR